MWKCKILSQFAISEMIYYTARPLFLYVEMNHILIVLHDNIANNMHGQMSTT